MRATAGERILSLLGDTDDPGALDWRRRCLERLATPVRPLEHGMHIRLPSKVTFVDGYEGDEFIVHKRGRKISLAIPGNSYPKYRIGNLRKWAWTLVPPKPETRVHKTVFG